MLNIQLRTTASKELFQKFPDVCNHAFDLAEDCIEINRHYLEGELTPPVKRYISINRNFIKRVKEQKAFGQIIWETFELYHGVVTEESPLIYLAAGYYDYLINLRKERLRAIKELNNEPYIVMGANRRPIIIGDLSRKASDAEIENLTYSYRPAVSKKSLNERIHRGFEGLCCMSKWMKQDQDQLDKIRAEDKEKDAFLQDLSINGELVWFQNNKNGFIDFINECFTKRDDQDYPIYQPLLESYACFCYETYMRYWRFRVDNNLCLSD